VNGLEDYLVSW